MAKKPKKFSEIRRKPKRKRKTNDILYNKQKWRRISRLYRIKNPFCEIKGCNNFSDHTDHIIPIADGGALYDERNLQSLCISCHGKKTRKEQKKLTSS